MDAKVILPVLIALLVMWSIYRRIRGTIGRQRVSPTRMRLRIAIFTILALVFGYASMRDMTLMGSLLGGIAGGCALAWVGLLHTKFESTKEGHFYTPHTYIGIAVSLLFIGRILYRFILIYAGAQAMPQPGANPLDAYQKSPLTLAIFGIVIGYYVLYYVGVMIKSGALVEAAQSEAN